MRAKVVAIESGSTYADGRRRVRLRVNDGDQANWRNEFVVSERGLGIVGLLLDDEIDIEFGCNAQRIREERRAAKIKKSKCSQCGDMILDDPNHPGYAGIHTCVGTGARS